MFVKWLYFALFLLFRRERVKRKRARLMKKSVEDLSENVTNGNQQPDLDKLQRDLPSGWQVLTSTLQLIVCIWMVYFVLVITNRVQLN